MGLYLGLFDVRLKSRFDDQLVAFPNSAESVWLMQKGQSLNNVSSHVV